MEGWTEETCYDQGRVLMEIIMLLFGCGVCCVVREEAVRNPKKKKKNDVRR